MRTNNRKEVFSSRSVELGSLPWWIAGVVLSESLFPVLTNAQVCFPLKNGDPTVRLITAGGSLQTTSGGRDIGHHFLVP